MMVMNAEYEHLNKFRHDNANLSPTVAEIGIRNAYASDYACLERCLRKLAGVTEMHLDRTRGVAHLSYDASQTSPEKIQSDVERLGYGCDCQPRAVSQSHAGHPSVGGQDRAPQHEHPVGMKHDIAAERETKRNAHAGHADHDAHAGQGAAMV